jgi:hypothetical protein
MFSLRFPANAACAYKQLVSSSHLCQSKSVISRDASLLLRCLLCALLTLLFCVPTLVRAQTDRLANTTVLIVRHAEKPAEGSGLTPQGVARAQAYARYFHPFMLDGQSLEIGALYAALDTKNSARPRLTLEPLSKATGLALDLRFSSDDPAALIAALRNEAHAQPVLICWRHKRIPALLAAFGADAGVLLPDGKWPEDVYDRVVVLHFDGAGHLDVQRIVQEPDLLR